MELPQGVVTHNIVEQVEFPGTGDLVFSRIPGALRLRLNGNAQKRSMHSAGCELRFRLKSPTAKISLRACDIAAEHHGGGLAQVLWGDFSQTYFPVTRELCTYEIKTPDMPPLLKSATTQRMFHPELVRILLPTHATICELSLEGDFAPPEPGDVPSLRVLNYGSSITNGSGALSSRECWAGHCAFLLGADIINLGFGGGCHCEPEMTDYLCERDDFDFAMLETGINMLGHEPKVANERIEGLIRRFSAAHPDKPVFCVGVFPCREDIETDYSGRAQEIRDMVQRAVTDVASPNLHFIDGRYLLTHSLGMTVDSVHPSPAGMIEIGSKVADAIRRIREQA